MRGLVLLLRTLILQNAQYRFNIKSIHKKEIRKKQCFTDTERTWLYTLSICFHAIQDNYNPITQSIRHKVADGVFYHE